MKTITPNKEKDQHFLIDKKILAKEIETAGLSKNDKVIEIGAGTGILTKELAKHCKEVLAFEIDKRFKDSLDQIKKENKNNNLKIIYDNALNYNWEGYNKIVSNLPYSLSEPAILNAISPSIEELTLIVGENFKNLLSEKESKIGIIADLFYDFHPIAKVNKQSFFPSPRVDSWLIQLTKKGELSNAEKILQGIVLKNGKVKNAVLYSLLEQGNTKNQAREIINKLGIHEAVLNKPVKKLTGKFLLRLKEELENLIL
ncbi:MAG: methyltransferase [Nanoarchaeota archaeon]|nr:methyltransferase [Nanoarchaeota archaeon]